MSVRVSVINVVEFSIALTPLFISEATILELSDILLHTLFDKSTQFFMLALVAFNNIYVLIKFLHFNT